VLRVDAELDPESVEARGGATAPVVDAPAHLEIHDADDAARCSLARRLGDPRVEHVVGRRIELAGDGERRLLAEEPGDTGALELAGRQLGAEAVEGGRVQPGAVHVGAHEDDRVIRRGGVEQRGRRGVGPQAVAEAPPTIVSPGAITDCP